MTIIDADKFLAYLIFSKHIDGLTCGEVKEVVEMCKVDDQLNQFEEGVNEAWKYVRKIVCPVRAGGLTHSELIEIFGMNSYSSIFEDNSASEVIAKIKDFEEKNICRFSDEIRVGDELENVNFETRYIVTKVVKNDHVSAISNDGQAVQFNPEMYRKTGRNFCQIAEVLAEARTKEGDLVQKGLENDTSKLQDRIAQSNEDYLMNVPEGITNGDVIKTLFPVKVITQYSNPFGDMFIVFTLNNEDQQVSLDWWNDPYKRKSSNERTESL